MQTKNKNIVQFDLDGKPVYVEVEDQQEAYGMQRVSRGDNGVAESENRFTDAVARIRPAAEAVLKAFQDMNTPEEIALEFGIKFNAKAGAVFASVDSEATFKVSLKWKNNAG